MSKYTKTLLTAAFATATIAAPAASFAQTPNAPMGTAGEQHNKEKSEMDQTRTDPGKPGAGLTGATPQTSGESRADDKTGMPSSSSSGAAASGSGSGTAGYTEANPAPPPNAQQNAPRPNN